jgi:hypothetical protein
MRSPRRPHVRLHLEILENRLALSALTSSTNWAGYAVQTNLNAPQPGAISAAAGSWVVPAVTGRGKAYAAIWVGIDGYTSNTVEQIGTDSDIVNGVPVYYAWYEMYPDPYVTIAGFRARPGDNISAQVFYSGGYFTLHIANHTNGQSFAVVKTRPDADRSSAEWIVEAPSSDFGVLPLANFGTTTIFGAKATVNGRFGAIDSAGAQNATINMAARGQLEAATSPLTDNAFGSSFQVTFVASTPTSRRPRRHFFQENDPATVMLALTATPPPPVNVQATVATTLVPIAFATTPVAAPPSTSSTMSPAFPSLFAFGGYAASTDSADESDTVGAALAAPFTVAPPASQPIQPAPATIQRDSSATPSRPPAPTDDGPALPNEQALMQLFADPGLADDQPESSPVELWSSARLAALASVLLFLGTPRIVAPEQFKRRQWQPV